MSLAALQDPLQMGPTTTIDRQIQIYTLAHEQEFLLIGI